MNFSLENNSIPEKNFLQLNLSSWLQRTCLKLGYKNPTKIQKLSIPKILAGNNIIMSAETGSGKTAAFVLPILEKLSVDPIGIYAIVLTPSRELAIQINEQFCIFGASMNLRCINIIGGVDSLAQSSDIKNIPHIVVGTPGRLCEILDKEHSLQKLLKNVKFVILDEVDRLIDKSLLFSVQTILDKLPKNRQTLMATATFDKKCMTDDQINKLLGENKQFEVIFANKLLQVVQTVAQKYVFAPEITKDTYFFSLLKGFEGLSIIVFLNRCKKCQYLKLMLQGLGLDCCSIHSLLTQKDRVENLKKFKRMKVPILLATDVASRGLDLKVVDIVINYDLPQDPKDYIHRVGRTARGGKRGMSVSIVLPKDVPRLHKIEELIGEKLSEYDFNEADAIELMKTVEKTKKIVKMKLNETGEDIIIKENILKKKRQKEIAMQKATQEKEKYSIEQLLNCAYLQRRPLKLKYCVNNNDNQIILLF